MQLPHYNKVWASMSVSPVFWFDKSVCEYQGAFWCDIKVDHERYGLCDLYELLVRMKLIKCYKLHHQLVHCGLLVFQEGRAKMQHSPKIEDTVEYYFFHFLNPIFFILLNCPLCQTRTIQYRCRVTGCLEWPGGLWKFWLSSLSHLRGRAIAL